MVCEMGQCDPRKFGGKGGKGGSHFFLLRLYLPNLRSARRHGAWNDDGVFSSKVETREKEKAQ